MQTHPLEDGKWRVFMRMDEFKQLLESAEHQRAQTAITVMGKSLRVGTAADVLMGQFYKDDDGGWWLHVEAKDSTERDRETKPRDIPFTKPVIEVIERHKEVSDLSSLPADEPLFTKTKRTLQRDVKDAAKNAAIATGNDEYRKISSHDLRRYYASHYLFRLEVDEHTVRQIGGWKKIEHMFEYLLLPRDLIKDRLAKAGLLGSNPLTMTRSGPVDQIQANFDTIEQLLRLRDATEVEEAIQSRLIELSNKTEGVTVVFDDPDAGHGDSDASTEDESAQASMQVFEDTKGATTPEIITKGAYVMCLVTTAWSLTLAPLL